MDKVQQILTTDPSDDPNTSSPIVNFIRFKVEPVVEYSLYTIGLITIVIGTIVAIYSGLKQWKNSSLNYDERTTLMRIKLSETIALGLTFILGAEVVKTFRIPTMFQLIKVSLLVLLRQLITYFLDKDVERLRKQFPNLQDK